MSEWQKIETAPKDGTIFLANDDEVGVVAAAWFIDEDGGEFALEPGWQVLNIQTGDTDHESSLTHWMPLPQPPEAKTRTSIPAPFQNAPAPRSKVQSNQ